MNPQVHVAMLGSRQHYAVPQLLHRAGMLGFLYADLYPFGCGLPAGRVISFNGFGLWYRWACRRVKGSRELERLYVEAARSFARRIRRSGLAGAQALFSYNGPAAELFPYAKEQGLRCVLEQIHIPQRIARRLLQEELEHWPGWEPGLSVGAEESLIEHREQSEWETADLILGGSPFALEGIPGPSVPASRCRVLPYGVSLEQFAPGDTGGVRSSRSLRVLFVGGINLRKGAPYLLEALRLLDSPLIEAKLAGPVALRRDLLRRYEKFAAFTGPASPGAVRRLYRWADVLAAPSVCEGSSLVTYEALACGVPVIATSNTGSWVRHEVDGLLVPLRDAAALAHSLERFARDMEFLKECRANAVSSRERLGLGAYQAGLIQAIQELFSGPPGRGGP